MIYMFPCTCTHLYMHMYILERPYCQLAEYFLLQKDHIEKELEKLTIRTNSLGKDRNYNRYWYFRREGRLFVESSDSKSWGYYTTKEEVIISVTINILSCVVLIHFCAFHPYFNFSIYFIMISWTCLWVH